MSGLYTLGFGQLATGLLTAALPLDTGNTAGQQPESALTNVTALAAAISIAGNSLDKTTVAGTRYYVGVTLGYAQLITGVYVRIGTTGGTDNWLVEIHDSTGALVATSATAGALVGTASTYQQFVLTTPYSAAAGTYYIAVQSNGTTAKLATYASPGLPLVTGSATGSFGTGASITPPTTYTANLGPHTMLY